MNKYNTLNEGYKSEDNVLKKKDVDEINIIYPKYNNFFKKPDGKEPSQMIIDELCTKPENTNPIHSKIEPIDPPIISINYGDNTLSFKNNGEIRLNDRLLETDKDIVNALRKLLKVDYI